MINDYLIIFTIFIVFILIIYIFYFKNKFYRNTFENFKNKKAEDNIYLEELLEKYGDLGIESIKVELKNFINKKVFVPVKYDALNNKYHLLKCFIMGKIKSNGKLKSRLISYNKELTNKKNIAKLNKIYGTIYSDPVKMHTIRMQLNIAHIEKRVIKSIDIKAAYLNGSLLQLYYLKIKPEIAKILCELAPVYSKYLNGNDELYVEVKKSVYGIPESNYIWYKKLTDDLQKIGYKISENDKSFMYHPKNKTHISIYVDDMLITATDEKYITEVHDYLFKLYGELNVGNDIKDNLEYVGLVLKQNQNNEIRIHQEPYVNKIIERFSTIKQSNLPYDKNLFTVRDRKKIDRNEINKILSKLMSAMYLSSVTRLDIALPIYTVISNIHNTDIDIDDKIESIYTYLNSNKNLGFNINPKNLVIYGWFDYNDNNQIMLYLSFGKTNTNIILFKIYNIKTEIESESNDGFFIKFTKSSKDAVNKIFNSVLSAKNFMEELGYKQKKITIYLNEKKRDYVKKYTDLIINQVEIEKNIEFKFIDESKMLTNLIAHSLDLKPFIKNRKEILQ
jgi:hypothetical protein